MGLILIVIGLGIAYLCWAEKSGIDYIEKKNQENSIGTESVLERRKRVETMILNNEKLTRSEWFFWYSYKIMFVVLKYGMYVGFAISILGIILWIIDKIQML